MTDMICPNCNQQINDDAKFCIFCGQSVSVSVAKVCPSCNMEYDKAMVFCTECGMKLVEKTIQSTAEPDNESEPQTAPDSLLFTITCGLHTGINTGEGGEMNVYSDRLELKIIREAKGHKVTNQAEKGQVLRTHTYYINDITKIKHDPMWHSPIFVFLFMRDGQKLKLSIIDRNQRKKFLSYIRYAVS